MKKDQINLLVDFEKLVNKVNCEEKEELCNKCLELNKIKKNNYEYSNLNIEYIQGIFDAEGHIYVSYKKINNQIKFSNGVYMKITQKNHPEIIKEIHKFLGFGKISEYIYYVDTFEDCLKLV